MPRYIKLDDAIEIAKNYAKVRLQLHDWSGQAVAEDIAEELRNLPTTDVKEVEYGYWIRLNQKSFSTCDSFWQCSECRHESICATDYCPFCGSSMNREKSENNE